jgi:dTDP-4-amino-4,6-dideoxygalactose transaminase
MPCDLTRIAGIAKTHRLAVVEDAACAIGSEILSGGRWEKVGKPHGDVACFSFHPRKVISTGDGGMLTTANPEWDRRFRLLRQHSMDLPDTVRHAARYVVFESYPEVGYNYRMTDIQAAIGREQLKRLPESLERRRSLAHSYRMMLAGIEGLGLPLEPEWARSNWQSFCIRIPVEFPQKEVMQALLDSGIATRRGIMCAHRERAYADGWRCGVPGCPGKMGCGHLTESEAAQDHAIILPLFHDIDEAQQKRVVAALANYLRARSRKVVM